MPTYSLQPASSFDYSSIAEVTAFTRHLLDGQPGFNSTTRPTAGDVTAFLRRCGGALNTALRGAGFQVPITNGTAKLACDDWVTARATELVELTQRGTGYSSKEGSRTGAFAGLHKSAADFAKENAIGFANLGVPRDKASGKGLLFTGQTAQADRGDPYNTGLEQPAFTRGMFDNVEGE